MSEAIKRFNGLSGTVDKKEVKKILVLAGAEGQQALARRLMEALKEADKYEVAVFNPGPLALEEIPACDLPGIDQVPHYISNEDFHGLNKAVSPDDIYQYITDLMINTIKKVGSLPWERSWEKTAFSEGKQAVNYETKKGYRGVNFFLLNFDVKLDENGEPYLVSRISENPYYLTFKQIEKFGGQLKKGSRGSRVVYFTKLFSHSETLENGEKLEFSTYDQKKFRDWITKNQYRLKILKQKGWDIERLANSYIPILKYYNVFNGADITGIEWGKLPQNENATKSDKEKIEIAEAILATTPNPPTIKFGGNQPAYYPVPDNILIPSIDKFRSEQEYYSTFFHEMVHSTGHKKRLSRPGITLGGTASKLDYAKEELVAEMGAVFLCAESGILFHIIDNSAKYLQGWNSRLIKSMEEDNRFYFRAASAAQAAADYILDRDKTGAPAYQKEAAALAAPWHEGLAKQALNNCSRLNPGYKYDKDGKLQRSKVTLKTLREVAKKAKDFDAAYKAVLLLDVPATVVKVLREKYNKDLKLNPKQVFELFYSEVTGNKKTSTSGTAEKKDTRATEKKAVLAKEKKGLHKFDKGQTVQVSKRWGKTQPGTEGIVKELRKSAHGDPMYAVTIGKDLLFFPEIVLQLPKKKLSKEELEKANPEPKSIKPKSVSISSAIDDVLSLDKFKGISKIQANILYKYFKNDIDNLDFDEEGFSRKYYDVSGFELGNMKKDTDYHFLMPGLDNEEALTVTEKGEDLLKAINNRIESKHNQKNNYALFDGLNGTKSKKNVTRKRKTVTKKTKSGLKSPIDGIIEPKTTAGENSIGGNCRPLLSGIKKITKASDIANMQFETLPLDEGWENLFQQAPKNMRIAVWAKPKNGKTAACCKFASYLTKFGPILYNFADQGINLSTKNLIEMSGLDKKPNAFITTSDTIKELVNDIEATGAQHVFIDMINQYINNGVTPHIFKKEVLQRFPNVGFTLILEVTKEGNFKGDQSWTHLVDQLVTIENYIMDTKGRYGTGEKISWEEGAQKYDPARYAEIKANTQTVAEAPAQNEVLASTAENEATYNFKVY